MSKGRIIWGGLLIAVMVLTAFTVNSDKNRLITHDLKVQISDPAENYLVNANDLTSYLYEKMDTVNGYNAEEIELYTIEQVLNQNSHVQNSEAYIDRKGEVHVQVDLKVPVLRVLTSNSRGYYLSKNAEIIEWSPNYTPRLIVATGNITKYEGQDTLAENHENILNALTYIGFKLKKSSYLQSIVDEIVVKDVNHFELVSKIGQARILIGDTTDLEGKLERFELFYTEAYPIVGWDKYREIDVRFKDKVYCRK